VRGVAANYNYNCAGDEQFSRLAVNASDPADKLIGDRMIGFSQQIG
jgi:hypothetical protein